MRIEVPYGKRTVEIRVDDGRVLGVVHPNQVSTGDPEQTIARALAKPLGSPTFQEFLSGDGDVLFIVNDGTRPTPTAQVLGMLAPMLEGVAVRFIVATGVHRAPTREEYDFIFGPLYERWADRIFAHDARRDEDMVYLGSSKNGTEMWVNRLGVEASRIVVIGSVEPHYFGGYTGGRKAFLPGIASYRTIEQNHRHAVRPEPRALLLEGNPVHEDMIDALRTVKDKRIFSIQTVLDAERRIYAATAGDIHESFYAAIEAANEVFCVSVPEKADVVVSVAPFPMDVDLYQSQKALDNGKLALKDGGILIMVSQCRTGLGERSFFELLSSSETPQAALDRIAAGYKLGWHKAAKMAEIALWAHMWAMTDLPEGEVSAAFMRPVKDLQAAVDEALDEKGPEARVLFLMDGCITVPMIAN